MPWNNSGNRRGCCSAYEGATIEGLFHSDSFFRWQNRSH
jgi:hypothetical protein